MYKIVGGVMVVAAGAYAGLNAAQALRQRAAVLRGLETALTLMAAEVAERLTPLDEAAVLLADNPSPPVAAFFRRIAADAADADETFSGRWRRSLNCFRPPLAAQEYQALERLGAVLGRYSADYQGQMISAASVRIAQLAQAAESDAAGRGRMLAALGLCGGLFAVILLL